MDNEYLCKHLKDLIKAMNPNCEEFFAFYDKDKKRFFFGFKEPKKKTNIITRQMAIYLSVGSTVFAKMLGSKMKRRI